MTIKLEMTCTNCEEVLIMDVSKADYDYYYQHNSFKEGSEAYERFFNGAGWVLKQAVFCGICKYDHSECYQD
mgnify:FL=1